MSILSQVTSLKPIVGVCLMGCILSCKPDAPSSSSAASTAAKPITHAKSAQENNQKKFSQALKVTVPASGDGKAQVTTTQGNTTGQSGYAISQPVVKKATPAKVVSDSKTAQKATKTAESKKSNAVVTAPVKTLKSPKIKFEQIRYDFGEITQGDTVDYKFKFSNIGKKPLVINSAKATCGCTQPSYPFMPIEPGETGFIGVRYVSVGKEGVQKPLITVNTNASQEPISLMLQGTVNVPKKETDKATQLAKREVLVKDETEASIDTIKN